MEPHVILIDRREQRPLTLPNAEAATLATGDYSIRTETVDYRDRIAVERKNLSDLLGVIGGGRERFERELERLALMPYPSIVVEASLADVIAGPQHTRIHPSSVLGSIVAWSVRYRLPIWFVDDHYTAGLIVQKILAKAAKYIQER